ncbi:undecaprenyl-diphosphate phosphatase [Paenibacillus spongiae]|uniref:undecaprenyl-diphosphate phosphatase n=1 Tax=Paenibacillus spongiae TaxID=2909671 RepID=UPI00283AB40C|nr:undecaprenyl-diphosphate phosphatase [Paenibacillus spongiae]
MEKAALRSGHLPFPSIGRRFDGCPNLRMTAEFLTSDALFLFLIGFIAAFVVAMIAVVTFLNLIKRLRLEWFAFYRFALAAVFYIFLM